MADLRHRWCVLAVALLIAGCAASGAGAQDVAAAAAAGSTCVPAAQRLMYIGDPGACTPSPPPVVNLGCEPCTFALWQTVTGALAKRLEAPYSLRLVHYAHGQALLNLACFSLPKAAPVSVAPGMGLPLSSMATMAMRSGPGFNTSAWRSTVYSYTLARLLPQLFPANANAPADTNALVATVMTQLGLDPLYMGSADASKARDLGNMLGAAMAAYAAADGWEASPALTTSINVDPLEDDVMFIPANNAYQLSQTCKWQPLLETAGRGFYQVQQHVAANLLRGAATLKPFSGPAAPFFANRTLSVPWGGGNSACVAAVDDVLAASAALTDDHKMMAQLFDIKSWGFGTAPAATMKAVKGPPTFLDLALFHGGIGGVFYDAALASFRLKPLLNGVRPVSIVHSKTNNVTAWAGPYQGTRTFPAARWLSYLRTQPHADWPSGSACICQAFAEWWELYVTRELRLPGFTYTASAPAGCSMVEPGAVPAAPWTKTWTSKADFVADCGASRVKAGVHFPGAVAAGVQLCTGLGEAVWAREQQLLGRA